MCTQRVERYDAGRCRRVAAAVGRNGGDVRTHAKVARLLTNGQRVTAVVCAGEQIAANHVVLATSLAPA